jgi:hypothetical protein
VACRVADVRAGRWCALRLAGRKVPHDFAHNRPNIGEIDEFIGVVHG